MRAKSVKEYRFPVNTNKRICSHATGPKKAILYAGYLVGFAAISMRWHPWRLLTHARIKNSGKLRMYLELRQQTRPKRCAIESLHGCDAKAICLTDHDSET